MKKIVSDNDALEARCDGTGGSFALVSRTPNTVDLDAGVNAQTLNPSLARLAPKLGVPFACVPLLGKGKFGPLN